MDRETSRRAVIGLLLGGGAAGTVADPSGYLSRFAPLSGGFWETADGELPDSVESQFGAATLRYDDEHVAHVEGETEAAAAFAAGYAQAADRLFQMDLQRRVMRGELSAVFGERALGSDRFHVRMDFLGAARATWAELRGTETGELVEAFAAGVNQHLDDLPPEFELVDYEPAPWQPVDTMLAEKQISWGLTGSFRTLRKETLAAAMGTDAADTLMPRLLDHDAVIFGRERRAGGSAAARSNPDPVDPDPRPTDPVLEQWLSGFASSPDVGSNSWVVSGEYTESGRPTMANDPHLSLMAPPVWYEQSIHAPGLDARGVTFPGVPFVVIGENAGGAWGFTNAGADVIDFYEYEFRGEGESRQYRYGDGWRDVERVPRTITVADGEDRDVVVERTTHGVLLGAESDGDELRTEVGVAWTGHTATRTTESVRAMNRSESTDAFEAALRTFDLPTQCCVYAGRDGETLFRVIGKVPIRRTDGEMVRGTRTFDGSAMDGEWNGFTPFGASDWDAESGAGGEGRGFIPFEEMPAVRNPGYLGTANQRVVDPEAYPYYLSEGYATPFRGMRLWERLEDRAAGADPVTHEFMQELQDDVYSVRAERFVPLLLEASAVAEGEVAAALERLADWDYRMTRDSEAALVFSRFLPHYRDVVFRPRLEAAGLDERRDPSAYFGNDWVLAGLDQDGAWFPDGRNAAVTRALSRALEELDSAGWETYGDYNVTAIDHPFDRGFLNYPRYPTDGSGATLNNFRKESSAGSSWRQVCPQNDTESACILPGGNDGSAFSDDYADQLHRWAETAYKPMGLGPDGEVAVEFGGDR
ncbi:MAG: penicillin acylase family protein [Halolamina sp.]